MISLVPGLKDTSENIKGIGIVDRFLEHSRFMIFHNGGSEEVFISSADLMTRNIEHRIEVTCPVFDKGIKNELKHIFDIQWKDNVKARVLDSTLSNNFIKPDKDNEVRSQVEVYEYIKKLKEKTSEK
jgi:polyphosphate kinase